MKFATQTINDMQHEYIKVYKTELEKATNNRIKVEVYPASQLGGAPRQTEGLRLGTIEAAIGPVELFVGADPRFQVPALVRPLQEPGALAPCGRRAGLPQGDLRHRGARAASSGSACIAYDMQSFVFKAPVAKVADFAGKRIRVLASEGEQSAIAALGGSAVPMSLPEVLPALQQGTIDGVNSVLGVFVAFRYYDAAPNLVDTALWPILSAALVSKVWFDRLPPDLKKTVLETGPKIEPELAKWQMHAHRSRHQGLDRQGRQDRQALARANRRRRCAGYPPRRRAVVAKSAPLKDLYDKLKAAAGN